MILWDMEERLEDALVAYLKKTIRDGINVYPAWTDEAIKYPCAVVTARATKPLSATASWNGQRVIEVEIPVITEAAPEKDGTGVILRTARQRNAAFRSLVMNALDIATLAAEINALGAADGLAVSQARVTQTIRSTEDREFVTVIMLEVKAAPGSIT
jgi:hypothetical protein